MSNLDNLSFEIKDVQDKLFTVDPSTEEYTVILNNLRILKQMQREDIKFKEAMDERKSKDDSLDKDLADYELKKSQQRVDILKAAIPALGSIGVALITIYAEETRCITSKALQFAKSIR